MIRQTAVAGQFYPASCQEVERQIESFNAILQQHQNVEQVLKSLARVIIVPHAGYVYSGFTANVAHRILANSKAKRVVVIGPSHKVYIKGASISLHESYETPCGELAMDVAYAKQLKQQFGLAFEKEAHFEHSTETQIPFIKHYLPDAKICEIVYGDINYLSVASIIDEVLQDKDSVVVISTDLSHFYSLKEANSLDNICLEAFDALDNAKMTSCEACGKIGVMAAIHVAKKLHLQSTLLDYRTSADITQDKSSVVGYLSAILTEH